MIDGKYLAKVLNIFVPLNNLTKARFDTSCFLWTLCLVLIHFCQSAILNCVKNEILCRKFEKNPQDNSK